jgi:hypothetical protein
MSYDLYGGFPPHARTDTSIDAADSIIDSINELQRTILAFILDTEGEDVTGATCDEIEEELGLKHQTASARVRELSQRGLIVDSGDRRPTRSGRQAIVWVRGDPETDGEADRGAPAPKPSDMEMEVAVKWMRKMVREEKQRGNKIPGEVVKLGRWLAHVHRVPPP